MTWKTIDRPGHFGKERDNIIAQYNNDHGEGNWRIQWQWGDQIIDKDLCYLIYEDAYFMDSFNRPDVWEELKKTAREVYDYQKDDIDSGLDYRIQKANGTHLQDISVRRVFVRRGWEFEGDELVRVRKHSTYWGNLFSPGKIPFHLPEMIVKPQLESWWQKDSAEDFYQSNKILQIRK